MEKFQLFFLFSIFASCQSQNSKLVMTIFTCDTGDDSGTGYFVEIEPSNGTYYIIGEFEAPSIVKMTSKDNDCDNVMSDGVNTYYDKKSNTMIANFGDILPSSNDIPIAVLDVQSKKWTTQFLIPAPFVGWEDLVYDNSKQLISGAALIGNSGPDNTAVWLTMDTNNKVIQKVPFPVGDYASASFYYDGSVYVVTISADIESWILIVNATTYETIHNVSIGDNNIIVSGYSGPIQNNEIYVFANGLDCDKGNITWGFGHLNLITGKVAVTACVDEDVNDGLINWSGLLAVFSEDSSIMTMADPIEQYSPIILNAKTGKVISYPDFSSLGNNGTVYIWSMDYFD